MIFLQGISMTNPSSGQLVLEESRKLRLLTLLLFYFTQGFPLGLFLVAIPGWMAAGGATTAQVATVTAAAALPWSLKLINGFLIDRYTYLPMGRRRVWIIGAQAVIVLVLLAGALALPAPTEVKLLIILGFCANVATTFQDVGIDSLAVDIMAEDERAKAAGIMFGAQALGYAAATALGGYLLQHVGIGLGLVALALLPGAVMTYGAIIRERSGEKQLPWTQGQSHPRNLDLQVEAWWPLIVNAARATVVPLSLLVLPVLLLRSVPFGAFEAFHPELFTQRAGWEISEYTSLMSISALIAGTVGLVLGGWLVDKIGSRPAIILFVTPAAALLFAFGLSEHLWGDSRFLIALVVTSDILGIFFAIALLPICMRLCHPAVAATQFTMYMAVSNFGRPLGSALAGFSTEAGSPQWMYLAAGAGFVLVVLIALLVRFPEAPKIVGAIADELPQGHGIAPRID